MARGALSPPPSAGEAPDSGPDDLEALLAGVAWAPPSLVLVSGVTGRTVEPGDVLDGAYWRGQEREPAAFAECVSTLAALEVDVVVEIGPEAVLAPAGGARVAVAGGRRGEPRGAGGIVEPPAQRTVGQWVCRGGGRRLRGRDWGSPLPASSREKAGAGSRCPATRSSAAATGSRRPNGCQGEPSMRVFGADKEVRLGPFEIVVENPILCGTFRGVRKREFYGMVPCGYTGR